MRRNFLYEADESIEGVANKFCRGSPCRQRLCISNGDGRAEQEADRASAD